MRGYGTGGQRTVWMADDLGDLGLPSRADLAVQSLGQVERAGEERAAPGLVADAVVPERLVGKGRVRMGIVTHEAAAGMGVEAKHEDDEQVVGVPESLEGLVPDLAVGSVAPLSARLRAGRVGQHRSEEAGGNARGEHEQHAQEHDMAGNAAGIAVVDYQCRLGPHLGLFNIEEAALKVSNAWLGRGRRPPMEWGRT